MPANLPIFFALSLTWFVVGGARALDDTTPVVIVLEDAPNLPGAARDRRFAEELSLALEGMVVRAMPAEPGFATAPLAEQLSLVRTSAADTQVAATVWLREAGDVVFLHLVALQTERALVRIVQAKQKPALEAELALLAKELLGEAYLFASAAQMAKPVQQAVADVRTTTRERSNAHLELGGFGEGGTHLYGAVGPSTQVGGGASFGVRVWHSVWLQASGHALSGPSGDTARADVRGVELGGSLALTLRASLGRVQLGPTLRGSLAQRRLDTRTAQGAERDLRTLAGRIGAGAELSLALAERTWLWLDATAGARLFRTALRAQSDQRTLVRSARFDTAVRVGVALRFR